MDQPYRANPDLPPEMRRYVEIGYIPVLEKITKEMSTAFWWTERDESRQLRRQGGTMCFVHTGERVLGITAGHVHQEYLRRAEKNPELSCQIGSSTFDPAARVIDWSTDPDIATYDVPEFYVAAAGAHVHFAPAWPPLVDESGAYLVGGWPWTLTREDGKYKDGLYAGVEKVTHSFLVILARLSSQSDRNLSILTYTSTSKPWGEACLPPATNLGGMSGGPVIDCRNGG